MPTPPSPENEIQEKQLRQQDASLAAGLSCILVGIVAGLAAMTHSTLPQALLFPGMLVLGTLLDETGTYLFYALSAFIDIVLYAAILYACLRVRRYIKTRSLKSQTIQTGETAPDTLSTPETAPRPEPLDQIR